MSAYATKYIEVALNAALATRTIESGNPIYVEGITVSAAGDISVDINDADGSDIMTLNCPANSTVVFEIPFIAYNGLVLPSGVATTFVTVFYRTDG